MTGHPLVWLGASAGGGVLPPVALQVLSARMRSANREGSSMSRVYANSSLPVPGMCHVSDALGCSRDPLLSSSCARILHTSQSVSQLFHGPAPRSPLHRTIERSIGREGHGTFLKTNEDRVYIGVHRTCFAVSRVFGYYAARSRSFFFPTDFWGAALVSSLTTLNTLL